MSLRLVSNSNFSKASRVVAAVAVAAMALAPVLAEARPGGKKSSGSRGSQTNSAPPSTSTAPGAAQPMQRTMTPAAPAAPGATAARPAVPAAGAAAAAAAAKPSFARNMMMGLGAGLLGAGLFGLLSGSGLFGGLGGIASFLGLILQAALIAGVIYLAIRFFRRRREEAANPAMASAAGVGMMPNMGNLNRESHAPQGVGSATQASATHAPVMAEPVLQPIELTEGDFGVFEKRLQGVMAAYSSEDLAALRNISTPEMVGYFAEDIAENARKGVIDVSKDVKLVKGDLAESWREGDAEYATVAMRFSMISTLSERVGGKIIEGHASIPHEATEIWTFLREPGNQSKGEWLLSAIQQTA